jgi:hypothetical protein
MESPDADNLAQARREGAGGDRTSIAFNPKIPPMSRIQLDSP